MIQACFYLEKVDAKEKLLAITDEALAKEFAKDMRGLLKGIRILYVPHKGPVKEIP